MPSTVAAPLIAPRLKRQLETLDWDFPDHLPGTSKAIHWYPGTFPSELPTTLIQALSRPDDLIFDPYGGIGTTTTEALRQGRKAWLVEQNPVACLASYVTGGLILLKAVNKSLPAILIDAVREKIGRCVQGRGSNQLPLDGHISSEIDVLLSQLIRPAPAELNLAHQREPHWRLLEKWVESRSLQDIIQIYEVVNDPQLGYFGRILSIILISAILRPASSQTKSWGHIADNVSPKEFLPKDVFQQALRWLSRTKSIVDKTEVAALNNQDTKLPRFWASHHNWQHEDQPILVPDCPANVIVTSPPYGGAIDYIFAQRLSLYFLGYADEEIRSLSQTEIGARRKRFSATSRGKWAEELVTSLSKQVSYVDASARLAFVLPHKDAGRDIGPASIETYLDSHGWHKLFEIDRSIRQLRTRQSWTSIKKETIQIYGGDEREE